MDRPPVANVFVDPTGWWPKQICGIGCLPICAGILQEPSGEIAKGYSFDELVERLQR
jgi:hypothetical protein